MEPSFLSFDPGQIPWQYEAMQEIWLDFDYSLGIHEILLSGSVGSAKSVFMAHNTVKHIVAHERARAVIGRLSKPDLRETLAMDIHAQLDGDFVEGEDFEHNISSLKWVFRNGSEIISRSWHDGKITKFRSIRASWAAIEELTENTGKYWEFYDALYQRLGRLPDVPQNVFMAATNPDGPSHPAYKKLIIGSESDPLKHVFYSLTRQNKFLPDWYIENLAQNLSPVQAKRMLEGQWVDDPKGVVYYNYERARNFRNEPYIFNLDYPIDLMHDFNIGVGKPMSAAVGQHINGVFHIAKTFIVEGADTNDIMREIDESGIFEKKAVFRVYGDASGQHRDPRSKTTDYEIIKNYLKRYRRRDKSELFFQMQFSRANPPIRKRHNRVNAKFCNYNQEIQLYIYKDAEEACEGFRTTKLKEGGQYLEDDSNRVQHITTAIGYWIVYITNKMAKNNSKFIQL